MSNDNKQFDADIDLNAAIAAHLRDAGEIVGRPPLPSEVHLPARPCPSPGMLQVGRIEFSPNTPAHLTNHTKDGKVGLFVPIPDLTTAARMLERFAEVLKVLSNDQEDFTSDEVLRVAKSLKGKR